MGDITRGGSSGGGVLPVFLSASIFNLASLGGLGGGGRFGLGSPVGDITRVLGGDTARVVGGDTARVVGGETARFVGGDTARVVGGDTARVVVVDDTACVAGAEIVRAIDRDTGGDAARVVGGGTDMGEGAGIEGGEDERVRDTFFESKEEYQDLKTRMK